MEVVRGETPKCSLPVLSIVVPMFNEAENVKPFYSSLKRVLDQLGESYEIISVNDGSRDRTLEE